MAVLSDTLSSSRWFGGHVDGMPAVRGLWRGISTADQVREQRYCGKPSCHQERRRRWKWNKRHSDADYRQNQAMAQRAWAAAHAGYWRDYCRAHDDYVERNRCWSENATSGGCGPS